MMKDQIDGAAMNVERRPEQIHRHRRALQMPTGTSTTPRRIPRRTGRFVFGLRRLPEGKVLRVFLRVVILRNARAGTHLALVEARQLSISRETIDREVDRSIFSLVRDAALDER